MEQSPISDVPPLEDTTYEKPKKIKIWLSNDDNYHKIFINPITADSWQKVLVRITEITHPSFGPVKKLVALSNLKSVTCFEELDPKEKYIAVGPSDKWRKVQELSQKLLSKNSEEKKLFYYGKFDTDLIPFLQINKRRHLTVIFVVINGQVMFPYKIVFKDSDLRNFDLIRDYIANLLGIDKGVQQICTIHGNEVQNSKDLQHGCLYVVVPVKETFQALDYMNAFHAGYKRMSDLQGAPTAKKWRNYKKTSNISSEKKINLEMTAAGSDSDIHSGADIPSSNSVSELQNIIDYESIPESQNTIRESKIQNTASLTDFPEKSDRVTLSDHQQDSNISNMAASSKISSNGLLVSNWSTFDRLYKNNRDKQEEYKNQIAEITASIRKYARRLKKLESVKSLQNIPGSGDIRS